MPLWLEIVIGWFVASGLGGLLWAAIGRKRAERDQLLREYYFELREREVPPALQRAVAQELRRRDIERAKRLE
jgi:hypothetical protein